MSLSKPFRLSHLPLVALENVLLQTDPKDLLFFALSSEKARQLLRKFSLAEYFDISVKQWAVIFSFLLKSGKRMEWHFFIDRYKPIPEESIISVFELDDMRMVLFKIDNEVRCELPREYYGDWTQRIGYFLQSIFPCQRIRKFGAGMVGCEDERAFFQMDGITSCEKFRYFGYNGDNMLEILEKTDVKRGITLTYDQFEYSNNPEWLKNEKIRNIPRLKLIYARNLDFSQFLSLENEHLHLESCEQNESAANAYLKKWVNGRLTERRTMTVTGEDGHGCNDKVWEGLTLEPVETWENLGKPEHVLFSDGFYLNPTPQTVPDAYQTVLLKNCEGQFATVVKTEEEFYFVSWAHPLPPIDIPEGHKLFPMGSPFVMVLSQNA